MMDLDCRRIRRLFNDLSTFFSHGYIDILLSLPIILGSLALYINRFAGGAEIRLGIYIQLVVSKGCLFILLS
ncbi:hypothetical protein C8J56DRAFT_253130 [Mycena floridula]|nr:hypothetical protein C8J56DRAFT_253130 [Mycena floridula]